MAEVTNIAWCDSTWNPWIGCQKVSPGCDNCYAETLMDKRYHRVQWGPHGERVRTSKANWRNPLKWHAGAAEFAAIHGRRRRVFCSSLADVFDKAAPAGARDDLWRRIEETPDMDWLLLTKRIENVRKFIPPAWREEPYWPRNIWLGVTAENQEAFDARWPVLQSIPAAVRFISYEPAIGALTFRPEDVEGLHWLICGGESGASFRYMPEEWADEVRFDCGLAGVAFFMKQMAGNGEIPERLQVREFPVVA